MPPIYPTGNPTRPRASYETARPSLDASARVRYAWASVRVVLGAIFFWAFLDKLLGLGYATKASSAWINGGSPTRGFLTFGTAGPFKEIYGAIAGHPAADALFMAGLAGVGLALLLGIGMRVAGVSGALMMLLMWTAHLPPQNHPFLDDHIVYALVLLALPLAGAGRTWGLGERWSRLPVVRRYRILE